MSVSQQIDIDRTDAPLRDFVLNLGAIREPIDLISHGAVVARITAPGELAPRERERILDAAWKVVDRVRKRTAEIPAAAIQKQVDKAVRQVRARHDRRGR